MSRAGKEHKNTIFGGLLGRAEEALKSRTRNIDAAVEDSLSNKKKKKKKKSRETGYY